MIHPKCAGCKKELSKFGGILLGPPNRKDYVKKHHLCQSCYQAVLRMLKLLK